MSYNTNDEVVNEYATKSIASSDEMNEEQEYKEEMIL